MNTQTVPESLRALLADVFDIPVDEVTPDLAIGSIPAWDSFGHLQAILALEAEFAIQFDPARIPNLKTVALLQQEVEAQGVKFPS